jgi:hypothetical protein
MSENTEQAAADVKSADCSQQGNASARRPDGAKDAAHGHA